jgi:DNA invertase Pin-like site-specific DNA recombinase
MAVIVCPEKGAPQGLHEAYGLKDLGGSGPVSGKECHSGRRRAAATRRHGTRTALYLRVSTAEQKPDLQYDGLRAYAARAGFDVVQDYCDVAVSGRREGRPQLNALMAAARDHDIDCVLVWKFDRFARSTRHLLAALEEFDHLGVRFVSVQDQVDTDSPMGRAMFTIIGAMAELESSLISERVTAGMRAAEARGKHLGRPAIPKRVVSEIQTLATSTDLSVRQIQARIAGRASRGIVGEITKRARASSSPTP